MMYKEKARELLALAGITLNGSAPYDLRVKDERFYKRALRGGTLALGESYMDDWWEVERLDEFFNKVISANLEDKIKKDTKLLSLALLARLTNMQSSKKAFEVGEKHYDIGNDLYSRMLGKRLVYTCGYWKHAKNLDEAQEAKLDLVCQKLDLKVGQRVLDIGCGWGSFAKFASEKYGVSVVGITVSKEQAELARRLCEGLDVEIRLQDYREVNEQFDYIVSLGMFEHVGYKNYRTYMETVHRCLKDDGLFLLHTIGGNYSVFSTDPWINKYIFPNGMLPSIKQIGTSIEKLFVMEDWHNFGNDYDKTLMAWYDNFKSHWPEISAKYSLRFFRMWSYYLLVCAGAFRARGNQLWQIVLSKKGVHGGYNSIR